MIQPPFSKTNQACSEFASYLLHGWHPNYCPFYYWLHRPTQIKKGKNTVSDRLKKHGRQTFGVVNASQESTRIAWWQGWKVRLCKLNPAYLTQLLVDDDSPCLSVYTPSLLTPLSSCPQKDCNILGGIIQAFLWSRNIVYILLPNS